MLIRCTCGEVRDIEDESFYEGSPSYLEHVREHHPEEWAALDRIEEQIHPRRKSGPFRAP